MSANDVMKTSDVTKNFNEKLQIYLSFEELTVFFYSFTFSSLSFAFIFRKKENISWL